MFHEPPKVGGNGGNGDGFRRGVRRSGFDPDRSARHNARSGGDHAGLRESDAGSVDATSPPVGAVDLCSLLTAADLKSATGLEYSAGDLDSVGQGLWNIEGASANTGSLVVAYIQPADLGFIKSTFGTGGVDLTVGGRPAFYNPTQGLSSLWVDVGGGRTFVLSFPRSSDLDPTYQALAVQLAELALSRM